MHPVLTEARDAIAPFVKVHREGEPPADEEIVQTVTTGAETRALVTVYNALEEALTPAPKAKAKE